MSEYATSCSTARHKTGLRRVRTDDVTGLRPARLFHAFVDLCAVYDDPLAAEKMKKANGYMLYSLLHDSRLATVRVRVAWRVLHGRAERGAAHR